MPMRKTAAEREIEKSRQIDEYVESVLAEAEPMTDDERRQIVALLRPTARRLRELRVSNG